MYLNYIYKILSRNGFPGVSFTSTVCASLAGNLGPSLPPKKIEFGIGGDAISRCLEGLTCILQSLLRRYSITFSIPPPPTLTISMQIWTYLEAGIFRKWGYIPPRPPGSATGDVTENNDITYPVLARLSCFLDVACSNKKAQLTLR